MEKINCFACGACCTAFEISTLNKPAGVPCKHLDHNGKCTDYENRPVVCREFKADELCVFLSTLSVERKIQIFTKIYVE